MHGAGGWGQGVAHSGPPGVRRLGGRASWAGGGVLGAVVALRVSADPSDLDRDRADRSPGPWVVSRSPGRPQSLGTR